MMKFRIGVAQFLCDCAVHLMAVDHIVIFTDRARVKMNHADGIYMTLEVLMSMIKRLPTEYRERTVELAARQIKGEQRDEKRKG